eukprot:CAMPEP_0183832012 /NCGR_PEP_ID=MMETSP0807_2-20130328/5116_1 /TAXON_ID=88271 /ORGANISM="Picocystis salinarum, Strain CCMP1897" /LENGTH=86 /DNA_ID=CAMNT_0026077633 /DNA_START=45 /DNA_END=305 /DNA_ORIENTATION=+
MAAAGEALRLYRALLREGTKFKNYNVREYTLRKVKEEFRNHRDDAGEDLQNALKKAREQLEVAKRQVAVYQLYAPAQLSIMDIKVN